MDGLRVTKLAQDARGFWTANISLNGTTVRVDSSCGSWAAPEGKGSAREARAGRFVLPAAARVLQAKVRREQRREEKSGPSADTPGPLKSEGTPS